jgi:hypothetical protein
MKERDRFSLFSVEWSTVPVPSIYKSIPNPTVYKTHCCVSGSALILFAWIRIQECKNHPQKYNNEKDFMFSFKVH